MSKNADMNNNGKKLTALKRQTLYFRFVLKL